MAEDEDEVTHFPEDDNPEQHMGDPVEPEVVE